MASAQGREGRTQHRAQPAGVVLVPAGEGQSPPHLAGCCVCEVAQHFTCCGQPAPPDTVLTMGTPGPTGEAAAGQDMACVAQLVRMGTTWHSYIGWGLYSTATQDRDYITQQHRIGTIWQSRRMRTI